MKKLLVVPFVLLGLQAFACGGYTDTLPKWRIGIIAAGHYQSPTRGFNPQFLPGVQLNRRIGNYELRLGYEQIRDNHISMPGPDYSWNTGYYNRNLLRFGIERGIQITPRFKMYGAADLAFQFSRSELDQNGCFGPIGTTQTVSHGVGVIPAIGLEYRIGKRVSCFVEYRAELFVNDVTEKFMYSSGNIDSRPVNSTEVDFNCGANGHVGFKVAF